MLTPTEKGPGRMKTTTKTALVALAMLAVLPSAVAAQRRPPPSVGDVLAMFDGGAALNRAGEEARHLLRQVNRRGESEPRTDAEIRTLVEGLVEIALDPDAPGASDAGLALVQAAWRPGVYVDGLGYDVGVRGEPVPGAFDALVRIYETRAARSLANGGEDPFMEAAWRYHEAWDPDGPPTFERGGLHGALRAVFAADPAPGGRGWEYVLALFERSDPPCKEGDGPPGPPDCTEGPGSVWCVAGDLLHHSILYGARPWPGPNPDLWKRRCRGMGGPGGGEPWNSGLVWRR